MSDKVHEVMQSIRESLRRRWGRSFSDAEACVLILDRVRALEAEADKLKQELAKSVPRTAALDALFRMANWQHGYGGRKVANTEDCVRCLDITLAKRGATEWAKAVREREAATEWAKAVREREAALAEVARLRERVHSDVCSARQCVCGGFTPQPHAGSPVGYDANGSPAEGLDDVLRAGKRD